MSYTSNGSVASLHWPLPCSTPASPAVHNEYCETPEDFIARRTRLAFLDRLACEQALPRVGGPRVAVLACS
jgi:hypothetical protein